MKTVHNGSETQQEPVLQHAKPVDVDAIRETVESGEVTKHRAEDQLIELCDEVEYLRKSYAELEADWEASDAEVARLTAELTALRQKCDDWADELHEIRALPPQVSESLGNCSREGCGRPAIEAKPGYVGPLYCGPRHAYIDRENRKGGESR